MNENNRPTNFLNTCIVFLLFLTILISLFAWITYGTLEGALGALAHTIIGLLNIFPWFIPFIGIPLGILDILGIYGFGMYNLTLNLARLDSSWMPVVWYWTMAILGSVIDIILTLFTIGWIKRLKYRKKEPKTNLALINCNIIDGNLKSSIINN
jgi:hypothetical protein